MKGIVMEAKKRFIVNVMFYGIIVVIITLAFKYVLPIMVPFIIAFCVAALLQIPVRRMKIRAASLRRLASAALCGVFYAIVALIVLLLGSRMINEIGALLSAIPKLFSNTILPLLDQAFNELETTVLPYDTTLASMIDRVATNIIQQITSWVTSFSGSALLRVTNIATAIPGLLVKVIITVISTFFISLDYDTVIGFLKRLIPKGRKELVDTSLHYTRTMLTAYVKSYSLLFCLTFFELSIGFSLLKIPYAGVLAITIAVFDLMPILGTGGILIPWALILFAIGNYSLGLGILALYIIITAIRNTLEPKIIGKQVGLHPLATLIAMLLGLGLFGLVGLLAFPVTLAVFTAMQRTKLERAAEAAAAAESNAQAAAPAEPQTQAQATQDTETNA